MFAVCLLSGGMDSSTLAYLAKSEGYRIIALHVNYGQRTESRERQAAVAVAGHLGAAEFLEVDISYLHLFGGSSLTDPSREVRDYDPGASGIPDTYVPFRNANLLAIATSCAEAKGASAIFTGVQAQDYSGYPDCRPEFIRAFQNVVDLGTRDDTRITIRTPFVNMTKSEILREGIRLGVPYHLTWSCYRSSERACGRCGSCHFRLAAFAEAGIPDPIPYEET